MNSVHLEAEDPGLWRAINPYAHIGGNPDLVVRLVHGDHGGRARYDVPLETSLDLDRALQDAGYDSELTMLEGEGHSAMQQSRSDAIDVIVRLALHPTE